MIRASNRAVVVAQLVERSLPKPEVRGSNPVIGENLYIYWTFVYCQLCIEKTKNKEKEAGNGPFFLKKKELQTAFELNENSWTEVQAWIEDFDWRKMVWAEIVSELAMASNPCGPV